MNLLQRLAKINFRQYGMLIALVAIIIFFVFATGGVILTPANVSNIIMQNSYIMVLSIGMLMVMVAGHIDLSVGSVAAFIGAVAAMFMVQYKMNFVLVIVIALALGGLVGAWQGFWIAYVRIPAFIATLAGMLIFRGLTMVTLQGRSIAPFPPYFRAISSGFIPDPFVYDDVRWMTIALGLVASAVYVFTEIMALRGKRKYHLETTSGVLLAAKMILVVAVINAFVYMLASYNGIPVVLAILICLIVAYTFLMRRTVAGRHIYALGGNEKAAVLSGVKTKRVLFWVLVNAGVMSALAGLIFSARLNAATPKAGVNFELDAIAACYIGGVSASGGIGTIVGAIIGALVMGVMNNGMSIIGVSIDWQQAIKGLVLLLAVAFDVVSKKKV